MYTENHQPRPEHLIGFITPVLKRAAFYLASGAALRSCTKWKVSLGRRAEWAVLSERKYWGQATSSKGKGRGSHADLGDEEAHATWPHGCRSVEFLTEQVRLPFLGELGTWFQWCHCGRVALLFNTKLEWILTCPVPGGEKKEKKMVNSGLAVFSLGFILDSREFSADANVW